MTKNLIFVALLVAASLPTMANADSVVNFAETFNGNDANWRGLDPGGNDILDFVATGGPDGSSYVSFETSFEDFPDASGFGGGQPTPSLFRGQNGFGSSNGAFEGDWINDQVAEFSFSFRHDAPFPLTVFARFATPFNFPGGLALEFAPALPNQWTDVTVAIDPNNPQFVSFEGSDFDSVFSAVGNLQIGVSVPVGIGGTTTPYRFDLDNVSVSTVPEPTIGFALLALGTILASRRQRQPSDF